MRAHAIILAGLSLATALLAPPAAAALPDFNAVRAAHPASDARLFDRNGQLLARRQILPGARRYDWVPLTDLPTTLQQGLLLSEDHRFFQHHGVDWQAVLGAAWENLRYNTHRGASTLTMQLVGLIDPALAWTAGGRSVQEKLRQIEAAQALEQHWSKAQILEAYVNLAPFRGRITGIDAAAQSLFGVQPQQLDAAQSALLVALLRGPNASPVLVARRACLLAHKMHAPPSACPRIRQLARQDLNHDHSQPPLHDLPPALLQKLLNQPGQKLASSLDAGLQANADRALRKGLAHLSHPVGGTVLIADSANGEILAWASHGPSISAGDAGPPRAFGQPLLPLLAGLAIDTGTDLTATDNAPLPLTPVFPLPPADTFPFLSASQVLEQNAWPAAWRWLDSLPPQTWSDFLSSFGLQLVAPDQPEPALGTLLALASAWQTLAADGAPHPLTLQPGGAAESGPQLSTTAASAITRLLADPRNHPASESVQVSARAAWLAGQSGCSQWSLGYTATRFILVWLDSADCRHPPAAAFPQWARLANLADTGSPSQPGDTPLDPQLTGTLHGDSSPFLPLLTDPLDHYSLKY